MSRFKYSKVETKMDCKMYRGKSQVNDEECDALTYLMCNKELCPFYKEKAENK